MNDMKLHTCTHKDNEISLLLEGAIVDNIIKQRCNYDKNNIYNEILNVVSHYIFLEENKNITISFYVNENKNMNMNKRGHH